MKRAVARPAAVVMVVGAADPVAAGPAAASTAAAGQAGEAVVMAAVVLPIAARRTSVESLAAAGQLAGRASSVVLRRPARVSSTGRFSGRLPVGGDRIPY
jgi:hypothetical protein